MKRVKLNDIVEIREHSCFEGIRGKVIKVDLWSPSEHMITVLIDGVDEQKFLESTLEVV